MERDLHTEVKKCMIERLDLRQTPDEIPNDVALFKDGLGLDSIDALELAVAIEKKFGVKIQAEDEQNKQVFRSVESLARHIGEQSAAK